MDITFNGRERTLRELCASALSSGCRIVRAFSKGSFRACEFCAVRCVCHHGDLQFQSSKITRTMYPPKHIEKYGGVVVIIFGRRNELGVFDHGDLQFRLAI
jgi:hypothetical protein